MALAPLNRWWTVVAGFLGTGFGVGIFLIYVLGVLTKPMVADLGIDRSVISFATSAFLVTTALGSVSLGILIHRFGVPRPTFVFLAVTVACIAAIPLLPPIPILFYALFAVMGVAGAAATAFPYTVSIAGLFDHGRGLALALVVAGGGAAGALCAQLTKVLDAEYGWRATFWIIAAIMATPLLTLAGVVRSPRGVTSEVASSAPQPSAWSLYLGRRAFWLIAPPMLSIAGATFILAILVPLLSDRGVSPGKATDMLSIAALTSLAGRIGVGWVLDRVWGPLVASAICLLALVGVLLVQFGGASTPALLVGACLLGLALGAEADLLTYLCSRYFSLGAFSRVVGAMWVVWAWGGGIATTAAGVAFRMTGSYDPAIWILQVLLVLSAGCVLLLGRYPYPPSHRRTDAPSEGAAAEPAAPLPS